MALVQGQFLVPDRDANDMVFGYTLRTIEWDDGKKFSSRQAEATRPKALAADTPFALRIPYRVVSTP